MITMIGEGKLSQIINIKIEENIVILPVSINKKGN
jgi:hypothetical protein